MQSLAKDRGFLLLYFGNPLRGAARLPHASVCSQPLPPTSWLHRGGSPLRWLCKRRPCAPRRAQRWRTGRVQRRRAYGAHGRWAGRTDGWCESSPLLCLSWTCIRCRHRRREPHRCLSPLLHRHWLDALRPCHTHCCSCCSTPRPGESQEEGRERHD